MIYILIIFSIITGGTKVEALAAQLAATTVSTPAPVVVKDTEAREEAEVQKQLAKVIASFFLPLIIIMLFILILSSIFILLCHRFVFIAIFKVFVEIFSVL